MRGGTFNLLTNRDPNVVKAEVEHLLTTFDLDYLGVQEATKYRLVLHDIEGYSYYTGGSVNGGASTEIGMLVKNVHDVSNVKNKAYGDGWLGVGWDNVRMQPRNFLVVTINNKHKKAVVHFPPGTDLENESPKDRYEDYAALAKRVRGFLSGPSFKTREVMGDWNCPPYVRSKWSPSWITSQTGSTLTSPDDRIDYVLTKGLKVVRIKKIQSTFEKSDHNLVIFITKPRYRRKHKDD